MKTFYHILGNTVLSTVTNFTVWFAITFYTYLQTQSVFATGMISGIYLTLVALSGFWLGSIVDHNRKKTVMLASSAFSLAMYLIAFFMYLTAPEGAFADVSNPRLWIFIPLLLVGVIAGNLRTIALPTLVTLMIPEESRAKVNGLVGTATGVSFLVVSVISGFLVGAGGMYYVLLFAVIMTVLAIAHMVFLSVPERDIVHADDAPKKIDIKGTLAAMSAVPGLLALVFFTTFNNFLGGVYMALMDAYGLSLVSVEVWGLLWGVLSTAFIIGGIVIAKYGLGKNPLRAMLGANLVIWGISSVFTIPGSIIVLAVGMFIYLTVVPFIEASEHTIIQKVVPLERQGRVFGFAQSVEQAASPLTAFVMGPVAQFVFIPFMTTGAGVTLIGDWFGTGPDRGIALVFTVTGVIGLIATVIAFHSRQYRALSNRYQEAPVAVDAPAH